MKVKVKGQIRDMLAFRGLVRARRKRFGAESTTPMPRDGVVRLAQRLHPARQHLVIGAVRDETPSARSFRLVPDVDSGTEHLAPFRAGQYLSVKESVGGVRVSRPYSISSAPSQAVGHDGHYELTIRKKDGGFLTEHIWARWEVGHKLTTSGPCGNFYFDPLRDLPAIAGVAGGSGITPFRSMARAIASGVMDAQLTLLYGSSEEADIIFFDELRELEAGSGGRLRTVFILSCAEVSLPECEQGFITSARIRRYVDAESSSFFVCGPPEMHRHVATELEALQVPSSRIRRETCRESATILDEPAFATVDPDSTYAIRVHMGQQTYSVPGRPTETVLVALERAGLAPPSQCRSGQCGVCRTLLLSGEVYVIPEADGRRSADRQYGYIHACVSYPRGDLEVVVPRDT